jgi:hypothetical protein
MEAAVNKGYTLDWHCLRRRSKRYEAEVKRNAPLKHALLVRWAKRSNPRWTVPADTVKPDRFQQAGLDFGEWE